MKARVKATGEIVEVLPYAEEDGAVRFYANMENKWHEAHEIDIVSEVTPPDYWTRLEHQYAGMAMQGMLSNQTVIKAITNCKATMEQVIPRNAYIFAHTLVEQLKEKEERK